MPSAKLADHDEGLEFVTGQGLHGEGLGWLDVHLPASALLSQCALMTRDRSLLAAAKELEIAVA